MPSKSAATKLYNSVSFIESDAITDIPARPVEKLRDIDRSIREMKKRKKKQRESDSFMQKIYTPALKTDALFSRFMQHLVPVTPQLDEDSEHDLLARRDDDAQRYYLDIHVSSFEKRRSMKRIDSGTLSRDIPDDEYRLYLRRLRYATMLNPIDYICNPEDIEGEYNNQYYALRSKFCSSKKGHGLVMIPNEMVDARTMTHNSLMQRSQIANSNSANAVSCITAEKSQFTGINEGLKKAYADKRDGKMFAYSFIEGKEAELKNALR